LVPSIPISTAGMSQVHSETESELLVDAPRSQPHWGRRAALFAGAAGLAALVGTLGVGRAGALSQLSGLQNKEERIAIVPSTPACSKAGANCYATGCCMTSGHKCFTKSKGIAQCNETCTPGLKGFTCDVVGSASVPVERPLGQSLYCFSVYVQNTGSKKKNTELELLSLQARSQASIFTCDQWDVFSDAAVQVGETGYVTVQVNDEYGEFHQVKRKCDDGDCSWVNWAIFYQVWVKVREVGKWEVTDYTVKVDPDAVFVPARLRSYLAATKGDSPHGVYFENCRNVKYGFFGHLEVMSNTATRVLTKYLENCHADFAPCANDGCDWEYGPWGEDVFAQRCMDHHYVDKVEAYDMSTDGACEADRPTGEKKNKKWHAPDCSQVTTVAAHPFKKPAEYLKCLGQMH